MVKSNAIHIYSPCLVLNHSATTRKILRQPALRAGWGTWKLSWTPKRPCLLQHFRRRGALRSHWPTCESNCRRYNTVVTWVYSCSAIKFNSAAFSTMVKWDQCEILFVNIICFDSVSCASAQRISDCFSKSLYCFLFDKSTLAKLDNLFPFSYTYL